MRRASRATESVVIRVSPSLRESPVCLARLQAVGILQLVAGDWEALLGYASDELDGRLLHEIVQGGAKACRALVARLGDHRLPDPLPVRIRPKGGAARTVYVYRRFDDYEQAVWLACEPSELELPISRLSRSSSSLSDA